MRDSGPERPALGVPKERPYSGGRLPAAAPRKLTMGPDFTRDCGRADLAGLVNPEAGDGAVYVSGLDFLSV